MERTWKPLTAGIVAIVSGAASIGKGAFILLLRGVLDNVDWGRWLGQWGGVWGPGMGWPEMFRFWPHAGMIEMLMLGASIALVTVGIIAIVGGDMCHSSPKVGTSAGWLYPGSAGHTTGRSLCPGSDRHVKEGVQ